MKLDPEKIPIVAALCICGYLAVPYVVPKSRALVQQEKTLPFAHVEKDRTVRGFITRDPFLRTDKYDKYVELLNVPNVSKDVPFGTPSASSSATSSGRGGTKQRFALDATIISKGRKFASIEQAIYQEGDTFSSNGTEYKVAQIESGRVVLENESGQLELWVSSLENAQKRKEAQKTRNFDVNANRKTPELQDLFQEDFEQFTPEVQSVNIDLEDIEGIISNIQSKNQDLEELFNNLNSR